MNKQLVEDLLDASLSMPGQHAEVHGRPVNLNLLTQAAAEIECQDGIKRMLCDVIRTLQQENATLRRRLRDET